MQPGRSFDCIGIIRNKEIEINSENFIQIKCDLCDEKQIESVFSDIDFQKYSEVIYLHSIGIDKFDPRGFPNVKPMETIDVSVYNTNVNSFKYLLRYCVKRIKDVNEKIFTKLSNTQSHETAKTCPHRALPPTTTVQCQMADNEKSI